MKALMMIALACGLGFSQTVDSKLKGKRIYMHKNDGGHQGGYDGLKALLEANKGIYGYEFEATGLNLSDEQLNTLFGRLYKGPDAAKPANAIDILIFCQGEGDGNMGRGPFPPNVSAGNFARHAMVNTHVRSGGALILVHAAAGREISYWSWEFGAKLMGAWFLDGCNASQAIQGNSGHFGANTTATAILDEETTQARNPSLYFIRNLFTMGKDKGGFGQPEFSTAIKGEWYHFNGNFKYEDGSGGAVVNSKHTQPMAPVRGHLGFPDSGIGPAMVIATLTKINSGAGYTPPGKGRAIAWAREVSPGPFDKNASGRNGRFLYTNVGHDGDEWTIANRWMGDQFLAMLRWSVKDERGCTNPAGAGYKPWSTVDDGVTCPTVSIDKTSLEIGKGGVIGSISSGSSALYVAIEKAGPHSVKVVTLKGRTVFANSGRGNASYRVADLEKGSYLVVLSVNGHSISKRVSLR